MMEALNWIYIYWYASLGALVGLIFGIIVRKEGVSFEVNIFWGIVGSIIMGVIGFGRGVGDGVFLAFIATWPFLFLINVFHQHHVEDTLGEQDHQAEVE